MEIRLTSHGFEITAELERYLASKRAIIKKCIPRSLRAHASCQFHFTQTLQGDTKSNTCSITLRFGETELKSKETTRHMYAALDIATVHLEDQLKLYSASHKTYFIRGRFGPR